MFQVCMFGTLKDAIRVNGVLGPPSRKAAILVKRSQTDTLPKPSFKFYLPIPTLVKAKIYSPTWCLAHYNNCRTYFIFAMLMPLKCVMYQLFGRKKDEAVKMLETCENAMFCLLKS